MCSQAKLPAIKQKIGVRVGPEFGVQANKKDINHQFDAGAVGPGNEVQANEAKTLQGVLWISIVFVGFEPER